VREHYEVIPPSPASEKEKKTEKKYRAPNRIGISKHERVNKRRWLEGDGVASLTLAARGITEEGGGTAHQWESNQRYHQSVGEDERKYVDWTRRTKGLENQTLSSKNYLKENRRPDWKGCATLHVNL